MIKLTLRAGVSGVALALLATPSAGWAQSTPTAPVKPGDPEATTDIIVTAQKREERLKDVPITISVLSGNALARQSVTNITELQNSAPELNYVGQPSAGYSIRGSGTQSFARTAENNVLLVVDGVVQGQLTPSTSSLFDIARVEVLGGPQGMLFGKNASAGVINIVTNAPDTRKSFARGRVSVGNRSYLVGNALANVALSPSIALRVTATHENRGATITNRFNGKGIDRRYTNGIRGRLLAEATPGLRFNLIGDYEDEHGGNAAWVARSVNPGSATSIAGRLANCGVVPSPTNTEVCLDGPTSRRIVNAGASLQTDLDLGGGYTLTNIGGYRRFKRDSDTDSDARPINALNNNYAGDRINQYSEELRVASPQGQTVEFVAGLFAYDYRYFSQVDQSGNLGALPFIATASSQTFVKQLSKAVFGQATIHLGDKFNLIAGARYTRDVVEGRFVSYTDLTKGIRFSGFGNVPGTSTRRVNTNNFSYRVGGQFRPSADLTVFATYSKGYKGPAVNNALAGGVAPAIVQPEIPHNLEGGIKTSLFDRHLNVDFSVYHNVVTNFQAQTTATANGTTQFVFTNADKLTFNGAQLNLYGSPMRGLTFSGGVNFNDAKYGRFVVPCNSPYLTGCSLVGTSQAINVEGKQLALSPRWKVTAGASYEAPVSDNIRAFVDTNLVYRSRVTTSASPDPNLVINHYALVDGRIGMKGTTGDWSIAVFAKNLFDYRAPTLIFRDPLSPTLNYMQAYQPNSFRTIGLTLEAGF